MCRGQPRPYPEGARPSAPAFSGFRSIYAHIFRRRTTKFDVEKRGSGIFIWSASHARGRTTEPSRSLVLGLPSLYAYIPSDTE